MLSTLGTPRYDLIDLLQSEVGRMVARRIDDAYGYTGNVENPLVASTAARMLELVRGMTREQLEACNSGLNTFFRIMPFSAAIPVVIEIERKWPHHVETILEANARLDVIRKGGEYAVIFSPEKIENLRACIAEIEEGF